MKSTWLVRFLCVVAVAGAVFTMLGCNAFTPERQRMRSQTVRDDLDHMTDDVDWLLFLNRPSIAYDETIHY